MHVFTPVPELLFKCAQFQLLIIMESWETNPFLDALILTTNIILVHSNISFSPHRHLPLDPQTFLIFFDTRKA